MASAVNRVAPRGITNECVWDDLAQSLRRVTVQIFGRSGHHGAGVVWRSDGLIMTSAHVVNGTSMIRLEDGRSCRAELVARDHRLDLAILRIPVSTLESAQRRPLIEADIRLLPGNSGGPLADASGRVVGINFMLANGMAVAVSTAAIERLPKEQFGSQQGTK